VAQSVERLCGAAHPDSRGCVTVWARRSLFGGAILAGLLFVALRVAPPVADTTPATARANEAHASLATPAPRGEAPAAVESRRDARKETRVSESKDPHRRSPVVAKASSAPAPQLSSPPQSAGIATSPIGAPERAYAQAMTQFIDSTEFADASAPLARLYFASFGRFPDQEGLDYYVAQRASGRSLDSIAEEFLGSREFEMRYGTVDDGTFLARVFSNVFGVAPDAAQRDYWLAALESGMSRGQLLLAFSEGADFRTLSANEVFVATAYAQALQRTPDDAGFAYWVSFLDAGNPREAVIEGLLASGAPRNSGRTPPRGG
jgi:hypothetical protein